jgi:hypothetical protein
VRPTTLSRYRQWMTHKLATWMINSKHQAASAAAGASHGVRCPSTITEEVRAIRETDGRKRH